MEFKKYPSINNHYNQGTIDRWVSKYPELLTERYIITEKIHGANFQIVIDGDKPLKFCSRNRILDGTEDFYDYQSVMADNEILIQTLIRYSINSRSKIRVYGELYGAGVQKGVYYSDKKEFKLFDMYKDDCLMSQEYMLGLMEFLGLDEFLDELVVPIVGRAESLQEALDFDTRFNSKLQDIEDNICEGVVIKPFDRVFEDENGSVFNIKKKNAEFKEKGGKEKTVLLVGEEFERVQELYKEYLTQNRLDNVFSKEGLIKEQNEMGKYIKLMMEDAKKDFFEDNMDDFNKLKDKEKSRVFSITGSIVAPMLQFYV